MRISDFPVLTFDTCGTLIDWETGIWEADATALLASGRANGPGGGPGGLRAGRIRLPGSGAGTPATEKEEVTPDFRFDSMAELVALHRAERG